VEAHLHAVRQEPRETLRTFIFRFTKEQLRREDMDFINERRWQAATRNARYNQALGRHRQRIVHSRELGVWDLVLRRILNQEGLLKLSPSWEGPLKVMEVR
jgi:hypothetical protein